MSGGSFEYLCYKDSDDILNHVSLIEQMADALLHYPDGEAAARETEEVTLYVVADVVEHIRRRAA